MCSFRQLILELPCFTGSLATSSLDIFTLADDIHKCMQRLELLSFLSNSLNAFSLASQTITKLDRSAERAREEPLPLQINERQLIKTLKATLQASEFFNERNPLYRLGWVRARDWSAYSQRAVLLGMKREREIHVHNSR